ncbi:hypothetical protein BGX27_009833 [Mortierella sp. AM989]|nr:hypothetical protein BGX27_009833 [Mortierella sp. AM989]
MNTLISPHTTCPVCWSKNQQILAKDEVIRAKDAVIAAKDDAIAQKDADLKAERELREYLQKQIKSAASREEKDALTIYVRNVTERITYEMLHKAFSVFGVICTLNMLHPKACAFVEFSTPGAYQRALAAATVPVGDGDEKVVVEKRVRRPQQPFARRPSRDNLKSTTAGSHLSPPIMTQSNMYLGSNNSSSCSINSVDSNGPTKIHSVYDDHIKTHGGWLKREDEGCDLTTIY